MLSLENDHPKVYQKFINFTVKISSSNTFIETTINRDYKTPGGKTGFSVRHGALQRWTMNSSYRASLRKLIRSKLSIKYNSSSLSLTWYCQR